MKLSLEDIHDDALRRLLILIYVEHLLTSMQENWREQYLFDAHDVIRREIEAYHHQIPKIISTPDVTINWNDPELYKALVTNEDAEWIRSLQPFADWIDDIMDGNDV